MKQAKFLLAIFAAAALTACNSGDDSDGPKSGDFGTIQVPDVSQLTQTAFADQTQTAKGVTFSTAGAWTSQIFDENDIAPTPPVPDDPEAKPDPAPTSRASAEWLSISPDHGNAAGSYTIGITLEANDTGKDRTAKIVITCDGNTITITIVQKAEKEDEEGDEPSERAPNGRLRKVAVYKNNVPEYTATLEYDTDNRITSYILSDEEEVFEKQTYAYTGNEELFVTETFYDKATIYTYTWDCSGIFTERFCQLDDAIYSNSGSNTRVAFAYKGNRGDRLDYISYTAEEDTEERYRDVYVDNSLGCCSQIKWQVRNSSSSSGQTFSYDDSNSLTDRTSGIGRQLFAQVTPNLNPVLLLIEEPDFPRALGFYGAGDPYMPVKAITTLGPGSGDIRQEFSYRNTTPASWKIGQTADCLEIDVKEYEGGTLHTTKRVVLTFDGI